MPYVSLSSEANGLLKLANRYVPNKVNTFKECDEFFIEFLIYAKRQPSIKHTKESFLMNSIQVRQCFKKYVEYLKKHPDTLYVKPIKK